MSVVDMQLPREPDGQTTRPRWQPSRAGILNVARYMRETFTFRDGWLELIGPNGSGKSMAVELLFPFLFDADMSPWRLSTFGKADRPMRDRLVGSRTGITTSSRTGYVWAEFRLPFSEGGADSYFTLGARLYASKNARSVDVDYFTSTSRVDADDSPVPDGLRLLTDADTPLTVSALKDALGDEGHVYATATAYRKAVRERLFEGLDEERFQTLISALIQLRRPKLSENLSDEDVSELLTAALPGLDGATVGQLATSFAELQRHEDEVARLDSRVREVRQLRDQQRIYARRVLNRAASDTVHARSKRDDARRDQRTVGEKLNDTQQQIESTERSQAELDRQLELTSTEYRTTIHSTAYQEAQQLALLEERTRQAVARAEQTQHRADRQAGVVEAARERATAADRAAGARAEEVRSLLDGQISPLARELSMVDDLLDAGDLPLDQAQSRVSTHLERRDEQIADVKKLLNRHAEQIERRDRLADELDDARDSYDRALTSKRQATEARDQAVADQQQALVDWATTRTPDLKIGHLAEELADAVDADPGASRERVTTLVRDQLDRVTETIDTTVADVTTTIEVLEADHTEFLHELERLRRDEEDDRDLAPEVPAWRTADRDGREGWPLWRAVAFHRSVDEPVRAAVEAGLEASGLLDAWLHPDGQLRSLDGHDLQALADRGAASRGRGTLLEVLRPEDDHPVPQLVTNLLASIGYAASAGDTDRGPVIGADGSFRLGRFHGTSGKPAAEMLGAVARQRTRAARIADLQDRVNDLTAHIDRLRKQVGRLNQDRRRAVDQHRSLPPLSPLEEADRTIDRAERAVGDRRSALERTEEVHRQADDAVRSLQHELATLAARAQLPTARERLDHLSTALRALTTACNRWLSARSRADDQRETAQLRQQEADREAARLCELEEQLAADTSEADNLQHALETARRNAGEDTLSITSRVERLEERLEELRVQIDGLASAIGELRERRGRLQSEAQEAVRAYHARQEQLDTHYRRVADLYREGLFVEAALEGIPEVTDGLGPDRATMTLELARAVTDELSTMQEHLYEHPNIERQKGNVADTLHRLSRSLSGSVELAHVLEEDSDHWGVEATFEQRTMNAAGLYDAMQEALDEERRLLGDHEREVLEETLTGSLRSHVAAQLRLARALVEEISQVLSTVRTASGMQVSLRWRTRGGLPASVRRARDLLKYDLARLDDHDKQALFDFFRERLDQLRYDEELEGAHRSYEERLMDLFDYRDWHEFKIDVSMPRDEDGKFTTKGSLSGGERSVALHLPLFAVLAAHYASAPEAPRMIILDELFVGIDAGNQRQLLAVIEELDLDAVVTSDSVWLAVAEVPGVAIHDLQPDDPDAGVTTIRFTWDGRELKADEPPTQPPLVDV